MAHANLTRKTQFAAAHRYWRPEWSAEENQRVFGACANPHGHGHNYRLEVTVSAEIDPRTGFSANMPALDEIIEREVVSVLDHQHLNHAVPEFAEGGLIPTCENILLWCWPRLKSGLSDSMQLKRLRLHEDDTFFVDYHGEAES